MYHQLATLDTSRTAWKIKVRVTRMWTSSSKGSKGSDNLKGYNLILLDDNNFHVHAENWRAISDIIVEGGVYIITSFYTKTATETFKPTRSKIVINFSNSTRVEKVPGDDFIIPNHKFDFIDLSDLHNTAESYEDLEKQDFAAASYVQTPDVAVNEKISVSE
ncbi:hypothetical protein DCAR_0101473 [Daucus carota subsp. sativus]|uniref:Replication protein A 70 kDa DNA-binding subunit B/D first OB fold domain-containing protein n=1 Tax=Daucus carota subsp. sativus TaxID=79200 RepID=A0A166GEN5_DAUCS|nr:hypothetical protein DCAR_0101473 [Daucus carota subsp. sativus]